MPAPSTASEAATRPPTACPGSAGFRLPVLLIYRVLAFLRRPGCSHVPMLARHQRPRGATPVRVPDLGRIRPSIRCDILSQFTLECAPPLTLALETSSPRCQHRAAPGAAFLFELRIGLSHLDYACHYSLCIECLSLSSSITPNLGSAMIGIALLVR